MVARYALLFKVNIMTFIQSCAGLFNDIFYTVSGLGIFQLLVGVLIFRVAYSVLLMTYRTGKRL